MKNKDASKCYQINWARESRRSVARKLEYEKARREKEMLAKTSLKDLIK